MEAMLSQKKLANHSEKSLFYERRQPEFSESKPKVATLCFKQAGASHKCPKCAVVFKLDAKELPADIVHCPVCLLFFSPSAETFIRD